MAGEVPLFPLKMHVLPGSRQSLPCLGYQAGRIMNYS